MFKVIDFIIEFIFVMLFVGGILTLVTLINPIAGAVMAIIFALPVIGDIHLRIKYSKKRTTPV